MLLHKALSGINLPSPATNSYGHSFFISDGIVCHQYAPTPHLPAVTIPLIPASQRLTLLKEHHDNPSAGYLGFEKTATKVRQVGYWVRMLQDIDNYCRGYSVC